MTEPHRRRLPVGAELVPEGAHFRVWAPKRKRVDVAIDDQFHALAPEDGGYFAGVVKGVGAGTRYKYRVDGSASWPDPASRQQPDGQHGASMVVDPTAFTWTDTDWRGIDPTRLVLYELHIGTFTQAGTFAAAAEQLPYLADL